MVGGTAKLAYSKFLVLPFRLGGGCPGRVYFLRMVENLTAKPPTVTPINGCAEREADKNISLRTLRSLVLKSRLHSIRLLVVLCGGVLLTPHVRAASPLVAVVLKSMGNAAKMKRRE